MTAAQLRLSIVVVAACVRARRIALAVEAVAS
jgi:hypothetical protein